MHLVWNKQTLRLLIYFTCETTSDGKSSDTTDPRLRDGVRNPTWQKIVFWVFFIFKISIFIFKNLKSALKQDLQKFDWLSITICHDLKKKYFKDF